MDSSIVSNDAWIWEARDGASTYRTIMFLLGDCLNRLDACDAGRNKVVEVVCGENSAHGLAFNQVKMKWLENLIRTV